tara:strand:+ start:85 stop:864 length:780 start_codon:yes stop_codon:yes gene_type:complete
MDEEKLIYLNNLYQKKTIPNIIFYGDNLTGKKTVLENFLNLIYKNQENIKKYVLIINCSHGKGNIKFIRETLKYFANFSINNIKNDNIILYTFKSIVLLNADKLTIDAQSALRRCIEIYSNNTRFFIVVENKQKILKPILSRFSHIYFNKKINIIDNKIYKPNKKITILNNILHKFNNNENINLISILNLTNKIYNNAISSNLLINYINSKLKDNFNKYYFLSLINNYKFFFKNDKLIILFCLNFFYLRNNNNLENIMF